MINVISVSKSGKNTLTSTDPNDFIFNSQYNTFKLIVSGTVTAGIPGTVSSYEIDVNHGLYFVPLVNAFMRQIGGSQVCTANSGIVFLYGTKLGVTYKVTFDSIKVDDTKIKMFISNTAGSTDVYIRYYCLEKI